MFFLFLSLVSLIPLVIGTTIVRMFKKSNLSKALFMFLLLASIWQLDVSILYAYGVFQEETVDFLFRLFRIGSILLTPALFNVAYMIVKEEFSNFHQSKWRYIMNKQNLFLFYLWSIFVYLVGWSEKGIDSLKIIQPSEAFHFYFPTYGSLSWIFHSNVLLFAISIIICFLICKRISKPSLRSFLFYFIVTTAVGYGIGILNMYPETRLFPSAVAVLVFAISILILSSRMHLSIVNTMNDELDQQRHFLSTVIDLNPNFIYAKDQEGRYSLINDSFADLLGKEKEEIIGKTDMEVQRDRNQATVIAKRDQRIFAERKGFTIPEEVVVDHKGDKRWLQTFKIPINTLDTPLLLGVSTDITERKNHEDKMTHHAYHDMLTGLPNRRMFQEDLTNILKRESDDIENAAIMLIDLDRFKYINDTLGHDVGDLLLAEVSIRLTEFLLENELTNAKVYRLGGDEFTLLFPHCTKQKAMPLANAILNQFKKGFMLGEHVYFITPSIGISIYPDDGSDAKTLVKNADTAMYYVKERAKNGYRLFSQEMNHHFYRKMIIEKELRSALDKEEFHLQYQPLMNVKSETICGMEALLRWNNKTLGEVSPVEFIQVAEETGLIIPIGEWVLKTACDQNYRWQQSGYAPMKVGVNISMRQLMDENFIDSVSTIIKESKLHPSFIDLEVTESIAMYDLDAMIAKLSKLKDIGVSLSMDDFGTGYSSLSYLKKYPLDTLKIDRSFIRDITNNEDNKAIVKSIISMAKNLRLCVTAEGVENQEEYQFLKSIHCNRVQGYGISYPLTAQNFECNILKDTRGRF